MSGALPLGWVEAKFSELNSYRGRTVDPSKSPDEVFELYSVPAFPTDKPEFLAGVKIGSTKQSVQPGDVLVCKINPRINRVWQVKPGPDRPQIASSEWIVMRTQQCHPSYLRHYFSSPFFRGLICDGVTGVGGSLTRAQPARVATFPVLVAPVTEQKRIADKLDALLARIGACSERLGRVPGILKQFRQSVLAVATSGELTRDWREARGLGEWPEVTLESVASGFSYGSSAKSAKSGSVPVLRMGNIQDGLLDWDDLVFTSNAAEVEKYRLYEGDVLFNRTNSPELVGKTAVFRGEREAIYAGYLIRVRCGEQLLPDFLNYCLGSPAGRDYCWRVKSDGVSQSNINAKKLAAFNFLLPSVSEQEEIVRRVKGLLSLSRALSVRAGIATRQVERLTPSVLDKAFRGQLVPQDPSDEPAWELLARAAAHRVAPPSAPQRKRALRAPKETSAMTKSRHDDDVKGKAYLAGLLRNLGEPSTADVLFKAAQLPVSDFYKQLAWEVAQGHVKDNSDTLEPGHAAG